MRGEGTYSSGGDTGEDGEGDEGSDRPKKAVVDTESLRRRLIERMELDSARSRERKDLPWSIWRRCGLKVRKMALSSSSGKRAESKTS